ncbi:hypothetical protein LJC59_00090 [Desulfovibrio sp. OttesenSCG-928-A18]|nr:hypothetical protein [Desulfovibrio sp. OttesenSCG-928-A18]
MCFSRCPSEAPDGTCAFQGPGPRTCAVEEAFNESCLTDILCPLCLAEGRDHSYLCYSDGDLLECAYCEDSHGMESWLLEYSRLAGSLTDERDKLRVDRDAQAAELFNSRTSLDKAREAADLLVRAVGAV